MPPFVSTAPSNKHESVKTINVQVVRSLRNAKRIKRKRLLSRKNKSSSHKRAVKTTFTVMQRGNQTKIKAFQNPFIMSKIQRK
jgi:hypothetical protein